MAAVDEGREGADLFDDILYGNRAREEHRRFQQVLGFVADEVLESRTSRGGPAGPEQRGRSSTTSAARSAGARDGRPLRDLNAEQLAAA
jgi:hypothetical protein